MSLGKIGKLTNVFNAFKQSPFSNKSDMISSLAAFGNINKAASYLNKVNSDGAISNTASKMLLYKAYAASGITKEEAGEALNNNLAGSSKFGLLGNIKNVGSGIAAVFKSIAPMMIPLIIGAAGIKAGKMLWDNVLTDNAAQKNLQESVQKYKTEKSDLDNLQSQKETNKQRVYELRAKSNRTAAEDNELNNLLNEDSILDAQIGLKKRTVTSAQKQQALDAKKALEKRTFQGELFGKSPYPVYQDTNIGYAQKLMSGLEDEKQARKDVLNNKEWSSERKEAELKAKDKTIVSYETELADVMSDISSNAQDLYDEDGNLIDKKNTQDLANNINDLFKAYSMLTNSSDYVSDKMDNIFALSKFSNLKDKLIEAGKSGGTDAIKDLISQTKDLDEAMSNAGIDADDLADGIMAIADPDAKNLEGIKDNLKDIFGKKYSFFKDKNDEDIEGFWDYLQDNNLNPEKMKWGKEDISDNWEDYLNSKRSTEIVDDTTFASRFKNSAEDTATDLDTITDNFQTDMSSIKSSMDSIKSGTFQNSDITDLIQQFPELATETDNLQQGLQNLAFDKASDAIGKIRDSVKDVTDPKQLAAADKYVQSIMDTMDLSGFDMSNAKSAILGNLTKNLADKHMASVTTPNQIELGNGAYESEDQGIRNVEDALQGLSDQFGLTKEQATALLPALEALGVVNIDPNVDMTGLDELDQATQDGMASLRQMQADGDIKLSFDVDSSIEGLSVDKLQSQIGELEHIKVNFDVDSSEYKAIQSMIDQREMQMHVQIAVDKTGDIDKLLSLSDEELAQKAELDVDVNTEDGKAKIDELRSSLESLSGDTPAISVKIDETQFQALTKEQQGQGTVTFKPEHKEVDAYLAEEKKSDGKVKWSNETGLVDVYAATEHYSHGTVHWGNDISAVQTSFTATGTVNWINAGGPSGGLSKEVQLSSGTFKAESTGSAYNVLNITPAHASGTNVAIKQDQQALVNEVGVNGHAESIVRDGVWSLIPGGAHIENLKKGDIIFSTTQTDALLKHGAIQGHARAYASGTVTSPGVMKAYAAAGNTPGFHFQGGAATVKPAGSGNSGNSGNSGLQHAIEDNTDAVSNNSDDTSDAADEVSEALQNVIKKLNDNAMDWVEIAMDRLDRITSRYTDLAESDYSHYTKAQKYYNKALENTDKEIKAAKESISVYKRKSEEVANNGEVSKYLNIKNPNTPAATTTKKYPFVGKVTASKLNVRKKPGTEHPLLPEYPMLNKDNLINVLGVTKDTKGDRWYKVSITKKEYVGYVSAKYIIKA